MDIAKTAVLYTIGKPLVIKNIIIPPLKSGAVLCRIKITTICGSDIHTVKGLRNEPLPLILGHEAVGEIVDIKASPDTKGLKKGDIVTWAIAVSCGKCFFCRKKLPQKCVSLYKYGHSSVKKWPFLTGGLSEYIYLLPGSAIYKIPQEISQKEILATANCTLATAVNAIENISFKKGETALVQGAGLLGLYITSLLRVKGASVIIVTDVNPDRLKLAGEFGADYTFNIQETGSSQNLQKTARETTGGYGIDNAFEACGNPESIKDGIESLRIGGKYLIAGMVTANSEIVLSGNNIIRKCLTLKGIHNYRPDHLEKGIDFMKKYINKFPFQKIIGASYSLGDVNEAFKEASSGKYIRVGIKP